MAVDLCSECLFLLWVLKHSCFEAFYFPSSLGANLFVSSLTAWSLLRPDFPSSCGIHGEAKILELDCVETDLLYRLRISPHFPSALSAPVLSVQMAHINKADSHTSMSNLFISPQTEQTRGRSLPDYWPRPLGPLAARQRSEEGWQSESQSVYSWHRRSGGTVQAGELLPPG